MATVEKRSISLPAELSAMIDQAVEGGEFGNASEVVREALRQWKERRELHGYTVDELRGLWEEGVDSGPPEPLTADAMMSVKERAQRRLQMAKKGV